MKFSSIFILILSFGIAIVYSWHIPMWVKSGLQRTGHVVRQTSGWKKIGVAAGSGTAVGTGIGMGLSLTMWEIMDTIEAIKQHKEDKETRKKIDILRRFFPINLHTEKRVLYFTLEDWTSDQIFSSLETALNKQSLTDFCFFDPDAEDGEKTIIKYSRTDDTGLLATFANKQKKSLDVWEC